MTELQKEQGTALQGWSDVQMAGEVSIQLAPGDLLVRHTRIFHATHLNVTDSSRLMSVRFVGLSPNAV